MSNLNSLKKSDLIALVEQLERNADDDRRRIGVMMYEANVLAQRVNELEAEVEGTVDDADEIDRLNDIVKTQAERIKALQDERDALEARCDKLEEIVASSPKRQAPPSNPKPAPQTPKPSSPQPMPTPASEYTQVVQVTDADRAVWAKFQALSREQRLEIFNWARPQFGHVGVHNIVAVRQAWHESKQQAA